MATLTYRDALNQALREEMQRDPDVFLMGEDSLRDLPSWHEPERILRAAELAVVGRPGIDVDLETVARAIPGIRERVHVVPSAEIDISASGIRHRVRAGEHRLTAAFIRQMDGPYEDLLRPNDWSLTGTETSYGTTALPHLVSLTVEGPYEAVGVSESPSRNSGPGRARTRRTSGGLERCSAVLPNRRRRPTSLRSPKPR